MEEKKLISLNFKSRNNWFLENLIYNRAFSLTLLIILISIIMSVFYRESFLSGSNFAAILLSLTSIGFLSIGMMLLLVSGSFDLSVGANLAVGGIMTVYLMSKFPAIPIPLAMIAGIATSTFFGFINGIIVAKIKVNALIATFATLGIIRAIATFFSGAGIVANPPKYLAFGQTVFLGLQMPVYYMIALLIVFSFLTFRIRYFRQLYFIGGNERAAELSGINVVKARIISFVIMGALAGFAGVVQTARLNMAMGTLATGIELPVITAAILGGCSIAGGRGTIAGAFTGALFIALIQNSLVIAGVNVYFQGIVTGAILIAAVAADLAILRKFGSR
ncbi:MAG: ABC transporter permease [Candidatus Humimicrobiaceae bacterium]